MSIYTLGIDIGSTASKCIMLEDGKEIVAKSLIDVGAGTSGPQRAIDQVLEAAGKTREEMAFILATGYGRNSLEEFADSQMSELSCHGKGAAFLFPEVRTVIDIGGQDTKGIALKNGRVMKFVMNDKCSAGTGKFLEIMTNRLGLTPEELSALARKGNEITISSMCTVFAESEVISLIGKETPREDIAFGVIESVVNKVVSLLAQVPNDRYFLTGGLCEDAYIIERLSKALNAPVSSVPLARYAGAIGAALMC